MIRIIASGPNGPVLVVAAEEFRATFLEHMMNIMKCHKPQLTEDEQQNVMKKAAKLIQEEYRATTWIVSIMQAVRCRNIDGFWILTPTILKWAGRRKIKAYKEPKPIIPKSKNGRVIRGTKNL